MVSSLPLIEIALDRNPILQRKNVRSQVEKAAQQTSCGAVGCVRLQLNLLFLAVAYLLPLGKRESSAKFDSTPIQPYSSENGQLAPLLVIECRGLEFIGFDPRGIWECKGSTGTVFPDIDLGEDGWNDYDEKAALPVGITEFKSQWSRV
ncbi:hypothetical protein C0995_011835 [Termitomyces sp. Mi166|nr:hypothetical protein C0995_011835 [Termitomyces sp. Mi166\